MCIRDRDWRKTNMRLSATGFVTATLALCSGGLASCASSGPVGGTSVTTVANASSATLDARLVKGYGKILVTSSGRTLYMLSVDPPGGSNCIGSCAIVWPALTAGGKTIKAGPGIDPTLVSSFKRSDGAVSYTHLSPSGAPAPPLRSCGGRAPEGPRAQGPAPSPQVLTAPLRPGPARRGARSGRAPSQLSLIHI